MPGTTRLITILVGQGQARIHSPDPAGATPFTIINKARRKTAKTLAHLKQEMAALKKVVTYPW